MDDDSAFPDAFKADGKLGKITHVLHAGRLYAMQPLEDFFKLALSTDSPSFTQFRAALTTIASPAATLPRPA
jgi:hypothetical protein